MRILLLSFFYQPEPNDVKAHLLGKELVERGHDVTAITTFPNYPHGQIYPGYNQKWRQWENKDGVKLLRVPLYPDHSRSSFKRALSYGSFMASAAILGPLLTRRPDVMWVFHPPLTTAFAGWWISLLKQAPFVLEIQDLWPESLSSTGMFSDSRGLRMVGRAAKFIYRRSAALAVNSPGFKRNLIGKGVPEDKIHIFPHWADETIYHPVDPDPAWGERYGLQGKFNVIFAGNMGPAQALHTVIDAAAQTQDSPDLQYVLIGDGLDLPSLQERARDLPNVRFIERQPAEHMPQFYAWADALLVTLKDDPLFTITIPSKTVSYLACGRPIVCAVAGDGAAVIRQANAGLTCPPEDASALAKAVKSLYTTPRPDREIMGSAGRQHFLTHYTRRVMVDRYEALFRAIARQK